MKDLIEYIAVSLVEAPDQVSVEKTKRDQTTVYQLRVSPEDRGRVIGRQGRTARSIRTVLSAAASRTGKRVVLEIVE
ncbi:MAG: KH domain-containing protein [Candidatus Eisenbacteria sp.]|nr:KH domain-containing protein [Candidatus Eisenbacteria bacterium]